MGCQLRAPEPSVTLVNSVKLGNVPSTKVQIAQKDGSEMITVEKALPLRRQAMRGTLVIVIHRCFRYSRSSACTRPDRTTVLPFEPLV
jgi:hypothetical protein